jgi:hypothetical protein
VGDFEEAISYAGGGMERLEVKGAMRWRREGLGLVSIKARHSKRGTGAYNIFCDKFQR